MDATPFVLKGKMERMTKRRGFFEAFVSCCFSQAQPILVVNRHDENALPRQVESVEMIGLGLKDHGPPPGSELTESFERAAPDTVF